MTRARLVALLIGASCVLSGRTSANDDVRAPIVQSESEVAYPEGARGDAVVLLELVVEKDGSVSRAEVIDGAEPFAEQARRAVLSWKLLPAQRDGVAVSARIRARIEFREPEPSEPPERLPPPAPLPTPVPAPAPPIEVEVEGERREIGRTTLSAADVRQTPGSFGDAFRAIETLPGVIPALSGVPFFFVRGSPPNNNGYSLDGVRIPSLFHVGLGPAVVHPGLIDRVDFFPGAAPASSGGVAGAVVAARTRPAAPRARGEASLRLVDSGALLETPFGNGRGTLLAAGRYGYPGPILGALSDLELSYWDYQGRLSWALGANDTLGLLAFGGHDRLAHREPTGEVTEDLVTDFHRVDVRHDRVFSRGKLRVAAALGYDLQGSDPWYLTNRSASLRLDVERQLSRALRLRAGTETRLDVYGLVEEALVDPEEPVVPSSVDPPPANVTHAAHADVVWKMTDRVEVVPGVRVTVFDSLRAGERTTVPALEPRFATRVLLASGVSWLSTIGVAHQFPVLRVGALPVVVAGGAGFPEGSSRLQRTVHQSQGLELALPEGVMLGVTAFSSHFSALTDLTSSCVQVEPPSAPVQPEPVGPAPYRCPSNAAVSGHAHGIELMIRRSLARRLGGAISYTLSRAVRDARFLTLSGGERTATVPSEFDRTHVVNALLSYDLGRRWRVGARAVVYSGAPYSELSGSVPVPPYNSRRDPAFFRLDLRAEKRWRLGERGFFAFIAEVQNATLSKESNTLGMDCTTDVSAGTQTTRCERGTVGPLTLPSVGVEASF